MSEYTQVSGSSFSKVVYYNYMIKWLNFVFFVRELYMNWIWNDGQTDEGEYETCEEHLFHFLDQTIIVLMKILIN